MEIGFYKGFTKIYKKHVIDIETDEKKKYILYFIKVFYLFTHNNYKVFYLFNYFYLNNYIC